MQYIIKFIKNAVKYILPESLYKIAQRLFWRVKGEFYEEKSFYKKILADGKTVPVAGDVKVSIICNVWNTPLDFLEQMIGSVLNQNYCNWELLINNCSNSDNVAVENFLQLYASEERIKIFRTVNHGIAANSNCLIERASGDFIFLMDHDDLLLPDTLVEMVAAQQKHDSDFIYADEIILFMNERHLLKNIKKPFSMPALERENFINHPALIRKELLIFSGGLREGFEGSQDHELYLRICEKTEKICYIPKLLYVWRYNSGSFSARHRDVCIASGKRAVEEHLERMNINAEVIAAKDQAVFTIQYDCE